MGFFRYRFAVVSGLFLGAMLAVSLGAPTAEAQPKKPRNLKKVRVQKSLKKTRNTSLGKFRNTYYYVVVEREYAGLPKSTEVLDKTGNILATVNEAFKRAMDIEGTGRLTDGRVLNFVSVIDGKIRYRISENPYGDGIGTCALVPFRTIAIDPSRVPVGSLVRIPSTIGMMLPNGEVHDGYWRADDIGGAIKHDRVDIFVGDGDQGHILVRQNIRHLMGLDIQLIQTPTSGNCATTPLRQLSQK